MLYLTINKIYLTLYKIYDILIADKGKEMVGIVLV